MYSASAVLAWLLRAVTPDRLPAGAINGRLREAGVPDTLAVELAKGLAVEAGDRHDDIGSWTSAVLVALDGATTPAVAPSAPTIPTAAAATAGSR